MEMELPCLTKSEIKRVLEWYELVKLAGKDNSLDKTIVDELVRAKTLQEKRFLY